MSNYGGIVRFGAYTFTHVQTHSDNFRTARVNVQTMPGMSGGMSTDGIYPAPTSVGRVSLSFVLVANDRADMEAARDAVNALYEVGLQKLVKQPTDAGDAERYCFAYVETISIDEDKSKHTDIFQRVKITFVVPSPFWESAAYASYTLADGKDLNDGLTFANGSFAVSASGLLTTTTLTNNGNAPAWCKVAVTCGVGQTCAMPTLQRLKNGAVADEVAYHGVLAAGDEWFVDGKRQFAHLNGVNVIGGLFSYKTIDFLRLAPGANTINIRFSNVGDAATARFWFNHTWR